MKAWVTGNHTSLTSFILLGFSDLPMHIQWSLNWILLCAYLGTITGNMLIMILVTLDSCLQNPMYFFLRNLSFVEVCFISITIPRALVSFIFRMSMISFVGCAVQTFLFSSLGVSECLFLGIMAYDRYLAICYPLRYIAIMTPRVCVTLVTASWLWGIMLSLGQTIFVFSWPYCGPNIINHFFCDMPAVLSLACADTFSNHISIFVAYVVGGLFPLLLIMFSYIHIISAILKMNSVVGRKKVFSTCSSHLLSVSIFYGSTMFMHLRVHSDHSQGQDKMYSLLYSVVAPLLNPVIYTLRNKEIKGAFGRVICKKLFLPEPNS
ncbi:olfactory receptor 5AN6-like [Ambystoma mexicanum]|uniref:olfactory receptor 5AN6-like n=1 Tax=Ambystoma mexicanum TaxID=8296 RepID=UPI0037E6FAC1